MKGLAYLDADNNVSYRTKDFLDNVDPMFIPNNYHHIIKAWNFDTEDFQTMLSMFRGFKDLKLGNQQVLEFSRTIGFDISKLRTVS